MATRPAGLGTKNNRAGEDLQQFNRGTDNFIRWAQKSGTVAMKLETKNSCAGEDQQQFTALLLAPISYYSPPV
jgi:hypothetical protein